MQREDQWDAYYYQYENISAFPSRKLAKGREGPIIPFDCQYRKVLEANLGGRYTIEMDKDEQCSMIATRLIQPHRLLRLRTAQFMSLIHFQESKVLSRRKV